MAPNKSHWIDKKSHLTLLKIDYLPPCLQLHLSLMPPFVLFNSPIAWKIAELTPISKDGDQEIANCRPFSRLPALSKICDRVAHDQLTSCLIANQRLSPKQCGQKEWNSTETSILQTTGTILEAIEKKQLTATVLLDRNKAFDSFDHETLVSKLQDTGLSPITTEWFPSYFQSRYQVVKIHNAISDQLPISCGLPQGSILGPLLFSI